jgi:hypothetical protein
LAASICRDRLYLFRIEFVHRHALLSTAGKTCHAKELVAVPFACGAIAHRRSERRVAGVHRNMAWPDY